ALLASSAIGVLPSASRSSMMPQPIIATSRKAVHRGSAELRSPGARSAVAAQSVYRHLHGTQHLDAKRIDLAGRVTARRVRLESSTPEVIHHGLGHDAAGRIAGAKKQHVVDLIVHTQ